MKIAIFTSGNISNGLWSSLNGEGRWATNLAQSFIDHIPGVKIDLFNDSLPIWGNQPPISNITMKSINAIDPKIQYNAAIYIPWDVRIKQEQGYIQCDKLTKYLKANLYIHNTFSYTSGIQAFNCSNQDHIVVVPFKEGYQQFINAGNINKFKFEFLPYPHGWNYLPADPSRKNILWSSKEVFHEAFATRSIHIPLMGVSVLNAMKTINDRFEIKENHFFSGQTVDNTYSTVANKLNVDSLVNKLNSPIKHNWLTYDKVKEVISTCRVAVPVAGLASSVTESICLGCLPLIYNGLPLSDIAEKNGILLNDKTATENEITEMIDLFMRDDNLYIKLINEYQEAMKDHLQINVANIFINIMGKYNA